MTDKEIIIKWGGATKLAQILGLDVSAGGVQRVHNWMKRGIPSKVKIERPDLFLRHEFSLELAPLHPDTQSHFDAKGQV